MEGKLIIDVAEKYREFCKEREIPFGRISTVNPYDETTLFCPAGMQGYKTKFKDEHHVGTVANIQSCIRMNDFDEIGDTTHMLAFDMIGLFSFREMSVMSAINFWLDFLETLDLVPDYATIHADAPAMGVAYARRSIPFKFDSGCTWTDGEIGGFCTEFYIDGVEVGNIVNPLGTCIDVGFGLERLTNAAIKAAGGTVVLPNKAEKLKITIQKIIDSGYKPAAKQQGYVLRKLLRELYASGDSIDHPYFHAEIDRQQKMLSKYDALKDKHADKSKEWWWDTHGIAIDEVLSA